MSHLKMVFLLKKAYFTKTKHLKCYEKTFLFSRKSSLCSQVVQIFVLPLSLLFFLSAIAKFLGKVDQRFKDITNPKVYEPKLKFRNISFLGS